jgi:hypothetical protein
MKVLLWFVLAGLGGSVFAADESAARADDHLARFSDAGNARRICHLVR